MLMIIMMTIELLPCWLWSDREVLHTRVKVNIIPTIGSNFGHHSMSFTWKMRADTHSLMAYFKLCQICQSWLHHSGFVAKSLVIW